jgi:membrane associated rhomboid family serine protease
MSSSDLSVQYCHLHPGRETLRSCSRCDRPTCGSCLRDAPVGSHCIACLKEAQPSTKTQAIRTAKVTKARATTMSAPVTRVLIAINLAIFVLTELTQSVPTLDLAVFASNGPDMGVANGEWWRLITSGFLHFTILHIGFNMYILWQLGHSLEPALGTWKFIGLYVVSLLGGSFGALLLTPFGLTGGASGAVFGLATAATIASRQRGIPFNASWGPTLLINLVITFAIPRISIGGHIGGMIFGGIAGALLMHPRLRDKDARRDLAMLIGLSAVAVVLAIVVSKSPVNGEGLWPRN